MAKRTESKGRTTGSTRKKKSVSGPTDEKTAKRDTYYAGEDRYKSDWGNMRTKRGQVRFNRWLDSLESADTFLKTRRSALFYKGLSVTMKKRIRTKLREVDPEGLKRLQQNLKHIARDNKVKEEVSKGVDVKESTVAVRERIQTTKGVSKVRFMDMEGLKGVVALCRAAGYSPDETAALVGMDPDDVNSLVSEADIKRALRRVPEAVRMAADQIVLKDLIAGEVTDRTEKADRIVDRRTKHSIAAHSEKREDRRESRELKKMRQKHWKDRFGATLEGEVVEDDDEDQDQDQDQDQNETEE